MKRSDFPEAGELCPHSEILPATRLPDLCEACCATREFARTLLPSPPALFHKLFPALLFQLHSGFRCASRARVLLRQSLDECYPWIFSAYIESADALRAIHLVGGDGHEINVELINVERDLSDSLSCIRMKENPALLAELSNFRDGLNDADFVVGQHH